MLQDLPSFINTSDSLNLPAFFDHSLHWCPICKKGYTKPCTNHILHRIKDKVLPPRAKLTLPSILQLKKLDELSDTENNGVITKKRIAKEIIFGPLEGPTFEDQSNKNSKHYKVFKFDGSSSTIYLNNPDKCSWETYMAQAQFEEDINVVAYQSQSEIYFMTTKEIEPNEELLVWYEEDYSKLMNAKQLPSRKKSSTSDDQVMDTVKDFHPSSNVIENNERPSLLAPFVEEESSSSIKNTIKRQCLLDELGDAEKDIASGNDSNSDGNKSLHGQSKVSEKSEARKKRDAKKQTWADRKTHKCSECDAVFVTSSRLSAHMNMHTGDRPFKCKTCDKAFSSKFKLDRHSLNHKEKTIHCPYCSRMFSRRDHLRSHLNTHDPHKKQFICEECNKVYQSSLCYKTHVSLHAVEKGNFTCLVCNKKFETKEEIDYHLKKHLGSRTLLSENDKKHNCSNCSKKFFSKKDLERHKIVHTKTKDFLCEHCPQTFGRQDHLNRHLKKTHKVELKTTKGPDSNEGNEIPEGERNEDTIDNSIVYLMQDAAKSVGIHPESNKIEDNQTITYAFAPNDTYYTVVNNEISSGQPQSQSLPQSGLSYILVDPTNPSQFAHIITDSNSEQLSTFQT